jgi:DDHD domain
MLPAITYRVNAAVDTHLSNSLKIASIPSSTASIWTSFGSVFRWSSTPPFVPAATAPIRPAAVTKLPSTVEMETHNFTREEIAEKRMLLLNDNGQIDYYLSGGGGPLNIQYLNMLSAHSSYWTLTDFVRFFVVEIARKQGREGTLAPFRAEKKKGWKYSKG